MERKKERERKKRKPLSFLNFSFDSGQHWQILNFKNEIPSHIELFLENLLKLFSSLVYIPLLLHLHFVSKVTSKYQHVHFD